MDNNLILKRMKYMLKYNNDVMLNVFQKGGYEITMPVLESFLSKEEDTDHTKLNDKKLAHFLNGLIIQYRGQKGDELPKAEKNLTNNLILRKLKIAFNLKDTDMIDILKSEDFRLSKSELSAFFRKPDHKHYRLCKDQVLRNFLFGLQKRLEK